MPSMQERRKRIEDLLDMQLSRIDDNPIYENYTSRNIQNYLNCIQILNRLIDEEKRHGE